MPSNERYHHFDLIKFIAIYFVLFYHNFFANTNFLDSNNYEIYINCFFKTILSCCVPLFFFVNGALLFNGKLDLKKNIIKIIKIILLTGIWGMITLTLLMFIRGEFLSIIEFLYGIWTWKQGWINHLWFLQALAVIYIFFPLIKNAYDTNNSVFTFFLIVTVICTFGNTFLSMLVNIAEYFVTINYLKGNFNFFNNFNPLRGIHGYSLAYFMLGGLFLKYKDKFSHRKIKLIAIITIPISMFLLMMFGVIMSLSNNEMFDVVWNGYDSIFTLINVFAISILSLSYNGRGAIGGFIKKVGNNTLGIFFVHILIGNFLEPFYSPLPIANNIIINAIYAFILLLASLGICLLFRKIPVIKKLFEL